MYQGKMVFSQLMEILPLKQFHKCVQRYQGDYKVQSFTCLDQFLCLAFAQLTYRESLRDIETCLRSQESKLYHMGIRGHVSRSTLADANETRDWRIYADFAQTLTAIGHPLYAQEPLGFELDETAYALDSSTIDLCLHLFPWATFRRQKGAVKMHTLLDLRGHIPTFIHISEGRVHDVNILDVLVPEPGSFYVMDRGYLDFSRLYSLHRQKAFFVTRAKRNLQFRRVYSHSVDKSTGVQCDQTVRLTGVRSQTEYPETLRRIRYRYPETGQRLVFLTHHFHLPAATIAALYKSRWPVELFFKWIKQHLRIKSFYGTSENAAKIQIWTAICVYLLVAILKKNLKLEQSLYTILQILSVTRFEKRPIFQVFSEVSYISDETSSQQQLNLFDL